MKLKAYFTYHNGLGLNKKKVEHFTVLKAGEWVFLRQDKPGPYYDPQSRPVWIFKGSRQVKGAEGAADATWVNCAAYWLRNPENSGKSPCQGSKEPMEPTCGFILDVPEWKPSPNDEQKKKVAAEFLQELRDFGYTEAKAVYVRDFNLDDPEIDFYIPGDDSQFQGCTFDSTKSPHCAWHMYGQAPLARLRREIMKRPYRLYPPPMGR